jgi:hypothetical protein
MPANVIQVKVQQICLQQMVKENCAKHFILAFWRGRSDGVGDEARCIILFGLNLFVHVNVCTYVCMYVRMHVCTYVCMYVWSKRDATCILLFGLNVFEPVYVLCMKEREKKKQEANVFSFFTSFLHMCICACVCVCVYMYIGRGGGGGFR